MADEPEKASWFDRAIDSYERSLKLRPDDVRTLNNLATALLTNWRIVADRSQKESPLERAKTTTAQAMELDAGVARYNYACYLAISGETDQAIKHLRQLLDEDPAKRQQVAEDFESLADHPEFQQLIRG